MESAISAVNQKEDIDGSSKHLMFPHLPVEVDMSMAAGS